ncbi:Pro-apoptotic serine protease [Zancudomyces culisetae]|uniref:Pro-apoptotic serine protease n=1 Tax=Zancudomyces culisetae TaxID=1213189 RepID=A0A1R1PVJ8_ZANCU|nr:Pro-apoptotic serine protease [Zancudomyces culisetae]|eukprot:OMH84964.1 Pro-apoptotic serine protease [Zancudomyces culisetae]
MLGSACAWRDSIILSVNHIPTPNLDAFAEAISSLTSGTRVPIKYFSIDKIHKEKIMIMNVTCQWHPFRMATRDPNTGLWSYKDLNKPLTSEIFESNTVKYPNLGANLTPANLLWPSFVSVDFYVPYLVDGMVNTQHYGPGYIIDKKHGLVLCDRDTVPISAGDVYLTFAQSLVITAKIVFLHPVYNFTVLQYNPELLGETDVEELKFSPEYYNGTKKLIQGDEAILVGVGSDHNPFVRRTLVSSRGMLSTNESSPPRWRVSNVEGIKLDDQPSCQGGVISDENGLVKSFWVNVSNSDSKGNNTSFMAGLDVSIIRPVVEGLKHGHKLELRSLDAEFWTIKPAAARSLGMSGERLKQMSDRCVDNYSKFYYVLGLMNRQSHASKLLNVGDVVLEVNGNLVTDITDLAVFYNLPHVDLTILREQEEIHLRVPTSELPTFETTRIISWAGAIVQQPYRAVQEQLQELPSMVYVTCTLFGSPANSYGLKPGVWITELEGERIKTLDDLTAFIKNINAKMRQKSHTSTTNAGGDVNPPEQSSLESSDSGEYVRMTVVNKLGVSKVLSLKLDEHYWPSMQILNVDSQWKVDFDVFNDNCTS